MDHLSEKKDWRLYVAPDHYTPVIKKTHVSDPVPFIFAGSDVKQASGLPYTEKTAEQTGVRVEKGYELMARLVNGWSSS